MKDSNRLVRSNQVLAQTKTNEAQTNEVSTLPPVSQWLCRQTSVESTAEAWRFYQKRRGMVRDWNRTVMPQGLDWGKAKLFPIEDESIPKFNQKKRD